MYCPTCGSSFHDECFAKPASGYRDCACRDCFEIAIGDEGAMCHDCVEAGCDGEGECDSPHSYGGLDEEEVDDE